jgi:hypothetical protein
MKKLLLLFSLFPLLLNAQTNPTAFTLTANSHSIFTSWVNTSTSGTAPTNMAFWVANGRQESTAPTVNGDWNCAYNLTANSRFVGKGTDGISMANTGTGGLATCANPTSTATIYPYAVVLALNTTNRVSVQVVWTGGTVAIGARPYLLQLQYRVGNSGVFTDVSGAIYNANATAAHSQIITSVLPVACENQPVVQVRWVYIQPTTGTGTRPELRLDEISVNSSPASPTLTVAPTSITNLTYTTTIGGPSPADSVIISGSALTGSPADITVTASTNFEVSKTSATTGFADNIPVPYTSVSLANTKIYVRLKSGLAENPYTGSITFSGGGLTSPPSVSLSGSVTSVPAPIVTVTGTLNPFISFIGVPPTSQSYTVSGINLVDNITITAPSGFLIKTGAGAYSTSLVLPQVSGNVATTTIDVRLVGTTIGSYAGNITHTSMTLTPAVNKAVTGTVSSTTPCGVSQKIRDVRNAIPELPSLPTGTGLVKTMKGQITGVFGANKFYMADSTGGIAVFMTNIVTTNSLAFGDSVQITGITARFNGEAEMITITCIAKLAPGILPTPKVFNVSTPPLGVNLLTFLDNNEGGYVKVIGVNLLTTGSFTAATNYPISACNNQGDSEIRIDATGTTNIPATTIPTVTQNITANIGHYITATQTVNILQLFPNKATDFENSAITCTPVIVPAAASCGPLAAATVPADSTLDVTCWNVEWLGNTTSSPSALGPTNDAQQMTNVLQVLNTVKSDIFCIEEVCDHKQFIARVKTDLPKYKVRCQTKYYSHFFDTPEIPTNPTTFSQKVCFVYDSTVVTMVDTISVLSNVYSYPANNWASGRLPFLFIGDVKVGNVTKQIHFVGLHAKSGSAIADYNRRKQDVIDLKLKLDTAYPNANIIMLGDYNDDLDTSIAAAQPSSYKNFVTDNINYKQISRALSLCGVSSTAKYPDIIDHFLMSNEFGVIPETGPNPAPSTSGIYYLDKTINVTRPINYVANYTTTTSDHYPVNARFRFGLPPATITSIATGNWSSASTWNCNCIPTSASDVVINTGNTVTVNVTAQAKSLNVKGILNWLAAFTLTLGM